MPSTRSVDRGLILTDPRYLYYLGGLFDGEGTIGCYGSYGSLEVAVTLTEPEVLDLYHEAFGGAIHAKKKPREDDKQAYRWRIYGKTAYTFLMAMRDYLRIKRHEAELAIAIHVMPQGEEKEMMKMQLKMLKKVEVL